MRLVFAPVGTSALGRLFGRPPLQPTPLPPKGEFHLGDIRMWSRHPADARAAAADRRLVQRAADELARRVRALASGTVDPTTGEPLQPGDLSAELNSLERMLGGSEERRQTVVVFLASATPAGQFCADVAQGALARLWPELHTEVERIDGLDPTDARRFQEGALPRLATLILDRYEREARAPNPPEVIFNVTGGFKGVLPFLGLIGLRCGASLRYLFEDSPEVVHLPRLWGDIRLAPTEKVPAHLAELFRVLHVAPGGTSPFAPRT